jgi:cholesterol transport system auxiliary component
MRSLMRIAPIVLALGLAGCSVGGLLGGGQKAPATLLTLTPEAAAPGEFARSAAAGEAVTIAVPAVPKELRAVRVPAQSGPTTIAYIQDLQWVDTPDRLFQQLISETVTRTTNKVVLDPKLTALDPGVLLTGQLSRMGYDEQERAVVVRFDGSLSRAGGTQVETRRFEARASADGTAGTVGPALNRAANEVALKVAQWVSG